MHVLIAVASRQGATREIAERIGGVLRAAGLTASVRDIESIDDLGGVDAVVVGSAVRIGHWLEPARRFVRDQATGLATRPVWLFSSGPIGVPLWPRGVPLEVDSVAATLNARDHRVFGGRLELRGLGIAELAIMRRAGARDGDHRPWPEIDRWAAEIALDLAAAPTAARDAAPIPA